MLAEHDVLVSPLNALVLGALKIEISKVFRTVRLSHAVVHRFTLSTFLKVRD